MVTGSIGTRMTRFAVCFSVVFLSCTAFGQTPGPSPTGAQAPVTSTSSPEVQQFQKIEDSWDDAVNKRDQYGLELVLSPLFLDVSGTGDITTRNQQVAYVITTEDQDDAPGAKGDRRSHAGRHCRSEWDLRSSSSGIVGTVGRKGCVYAGV